MHVFFGCKAKTGEFIFGNDCTRFGKGKLYFLTENALQRLMNKGIARDFATHLLFPQ